MHLLDNQWVASWAEPSLARFLRCLYHAQDPCDLRVGDIDPRIFGGFAEHLGRHIHDGVYEPGHPKADKEGLRVQKIVAALYESARQRSEVLIK